MGKGSRDRGRGGLASFRLGEVVVAVVEIGMDQSVEWEAGKGLEWHSSEVLQIRWVELHSASWEALHSDLDQRLPGRMELEIR